MILQQTTIGRSAQFLLFVFGSILAATQCSYAAPAGTPFTAEEITVQAKGHTLGCTLLMPKGATDKVPALITISGLGLQTRDATIDIPNLQQYRPFRQIAEIAAARGMAVLRCDDRGVGRSTGADGLLDASNSDLADDTRAQIEYLRSRQDIDKKRIALLGHGEGGLIAPMIAETDKSLAAIVLMGTTGKRGADIVLFQLNRAVDHDATLTDDGKAQMHDKNRELIKAVISSADTTTLPSVFRYRFARDYLAYDPLPSMTKVKQPVLILQGQLDRMVTPDNCTLMEQAARKGGNQDVTSHFFINLNHLFLPAQRGDEAEYSSLQDAALPTEVTEVISDWLQAKLKIAK